MRDKVQLGFSFLADFCTNPEYGVLKVVDGQVDLDRQKAFNRARRKLNAGGSIFRVLRHAPWKNPVRFDYDCPGFWPLFLEYCDIIHQPCQKAGKGQGADVWIESVDGCGRIGAPGQTTLDKEWIFKDEVRLRELFRLFFERTASRPFIRIGCGNEIGGTTAQCREYHEIVFDEFKRAGRIPFSFGAVYSQLEDNLELVKKIAGEKRFWGDVSNKLIYREVHRIGSASSEHLREVVEQWGDRPIRWCASSDGIHPRPNLVEWGSVLAYVFSKVKNLEIKVPADTKQKLICELFGEVIEGDPYYSSSDKVMVNASGIYKQKFEVMPVNYGKYPDDWVEPGPPPQPPTVLVEVCAASGLLPNEWCPAREVKTFLKGEEPTTICPVHRAPERSCYEKYIAHRPIGKWQVGRFISCLFGHH